MTDQFTGDYALEPMPAPAVHPGEFVIAAASLEHGHIYGMCRGLVEAGATVEWVFDRDAEKAAAFTRSFPGARIAASLDEILNEPNVRLVCAAAVPNERANLGVRVMEAGKDYFTDKTPLTTLDQLGRVRRTAERTGRKYFVYYSERIHSEAGVYAGQLVERGVIGRPVHVDGFGPHRIGPPESRPDWFYDHARYGGILCDIGSHQIEQFLFYCGCSDAQVKCAHVDNFAHKVYPGLEDFGEATLIGDNGATQHFRVDWLTPEGLSTWGDGRVFILGTEGYIELRKYVNVASHDGTHDHVYVVDSRGERHFDVSGRVGYPFFRDVILDCLNRTERAMTQAHALKAAELCVKAQLAANAPFGD
ncbi:MAG: Gfo/Idh/MocA family oxidoreductase [Clostridia bacterium]|nr:Gfo/Idh/MocA family oxidoreductase [Clostridia bacterium]